MYVDYYPISLYISAGSALLFSQEPGEEIDMLPYLIFVYYINVIPLVE